MGIVAKPHTYIPFEDILADQANENDDAIFGTVNGGLTDVNINAAAAIAQSKISGLTTSLNAKKASTDLYRLIDRTEVVLVNTAIETQLTHAPIPAGTMNSSDCLNGKHVALITSILDGAGFFLRFYWGPVGAQTLMHQADFVNESGDTLTNVGLITDFHIFNRSSLAVQGLAFVTARNDEASGSSIKSSVSGASENTGVACSLLINGLWSGASASNSCQGLGVEIKRQR